MKISLTCVCSGFCLGLVCEGWEGSLTGEFLEDSPILDPGRELPPPRPPRRPPPPPGESSSAPSVVKCNCQSCHLDISMEIQVFREIFSPLSSSFLLGFPDPKPTELDDWLFIFMSAFESRVNLRDKKNPSKVELILGCSLSLLTCLWFLWNLRLPISS